MKQYRITKVIYADNIVHAIALDETAEIVQVDLMDEVKPEAQLVGFTQPTKKVKKKK